MSVRRSLTAIPTMPAYEMMVVPKSEFPRSKLSIIIPAHNEERRLPGSLDKIMAWMQTVPFEVEVLIVENGSQDRTTEIAEQYARCCPKIRTLHSAKGKGAAVCKGMMLGCGDYLFICDADLSMPIGEVEKFLSPCVAGCDVVIGSREVPGAMRYGEPYYRHVMGRVFNSIVQCLLVPGLCDTQCGFKLFTQAAARELFACLTITGWSFDVEALHIAAKRGYRIREVPINWYFDADSRVRPLQDTWRMLLDVIHIRVNDLRGRYG